MDELKNVIGNLEANNILINNVKENKESFPLIGEAADITTNIQGNDDDSTFFFDA